MPWLQITLLVAPAKADHLSDMLSAVGAEAVTFQDAAADPVFEPAPGTTPLWAQTRVIGLFPADIDTNQLLTQLAAKLAPRPLPAYQINPLEDKDWDRAWMEHFQPLHLGGNLWICPSWRAPVDPDAINILLDPGLAFGTGSHPTTALCLEWLALHPCAGETVIDYGCGSGILAIAAAKLGAKHISAIDYDPQALQATRNNADKNGISQHIVTGLPGELPEQPADLLLANILANPLIELAPLFARLVKPGKHLVLSGILTEQAEQVARCYQTWFHLLPRAERDGWVRMEGVRMS